MEVLLIVVSEIVVRGASGSVDVLMVLVSLVTLICDEVGMLLSLELPVANVGETLDNVLAVRVCAAVVALLSLSLTVKGVREVSESVGVLTVLVSLVGFVCGVCGAVVMPFEFLLHRLKKLFVAHQRVFASRWLHWSEMQSAYYFRLHSFVELFVKHRTAWKFLQYSSQSLHCCVMKL